MAELPGQGLDGDEAEERTNWIDAGGYNVEIINSNGEKRDKGIYRVGLQLKVIDGEKAGRTFWLSFNYLNPNSAQNQDISQNQLRLIAKACGVGLFKNTEDLHNKPFHITVKVSESGGYTNNDMTNARPYQQGGSGAKGGSASKSSTSSKSKSEKTEGEGGGDASKGGGKPWQKKK